MHYKDLIKPEATCSDRNCPYHGDLRIHGASFEGTVISARAPKTVSVAWTRTSRIKKYDRFIKEKTKVLAHNPECINAKAGDRVVVYETRPISRWKHFVVVRKL